MSVNIIRPDIGRDYGYVDAGVIDAVVGTMISNDNRLLPEQTIAPKVWKCGWYNMSVNTESARRQCYYQRGDAVWINTENLDSFVDSNYDYIKSVVEGNSTLKYMYAEVDGDTTGTHEFFKKVATGEVTGNPDGLPLFYLGEQTGKTQIRVSLSANNDKLPNDDLYWKDFFTDYETNARLSILDCADSLCRQYMDRHLLEYHLSGIGAALYDENTGVQRQFNDIYLCNNLSNLTGEQQYSPTKELTVSRGFDWVVKYYHKRFNDGRTCKWFRVWNSGLVEHGGMVVVDETCAKEMQDELAYAGKDGTATSYRVRLDWKSQQCQAPAYKYGTNAGGFYIYDTRFDLGDGFGVPLQEISRSVDAADRYVVQVTPFSDCAEPYSTMRPVGGVRQGYYYTTREVFDMKNDSFCFILTPGCCSYSYNVRGFIPNVQQGYK